MRTDMQTFTVSCNDLMGDQEYPRPSVLRGNLWMRQAVRTKFFFNRLEVWHNQAVLEKSTSISV